MRTLAVALLLLPAAALAEQPALHCLPIERVVCEGVGPCQRFDEASLEVTLWPEPTPVEDCRALTCPPLPPRIALCGIEVCGEGTVQHLPHARLEDFGLRRGMAYVVPDPPPAIYASTHYALAYDPAAHRLALSRFDGTSLETTWLACFPEATDG